MLMVYRISVAVVFASLLAGCAVGPNYLRPKVVVPDAYKEVEGWKPAQPKDDTVRGAWWEIFNDPQLNALEERVSISNQNVLIAEAQFRQASALVRAAQASYFPTVTAGGSYTRSVRSSNITQVPGVSTKVISDHLLPAGASWELDVWGRIRRTVEASKATAQASASDLEAVRLSAQAALAQAYFQLLTVDAQKQLVEATVVAYQRSLDLTKNRYGSGVASKADVLQAETLLKTTQAQAIDLGIQRAQLEHAIALLVGTPASTFSIPVSLLTAPPPAIPAGVPSELLERRPDVGGAERRVAAANAQIGVALAAFFPKITLAASAGFESSDLNNLLMWPSRFWSLGPLGLSETVFEGGLRRALTDQARAAYDGAVASYRQTVLTGFQEVEDNVAALRILEGEALVQEEAVKAARQSAEVALNQYKAGTVSYLNVVVAQTTALSNERTAVDIRGRRMAASVLLIKALGGDWERPKEEARAGAPGGNGQNP